MINDPTSSEEGIMALKMHCLAFILFLILAFSGVVPVGKPINTQDWPLVYKSQAQLMCESSGDPWACGVMAQGLMLPSPEEAKRSPASADLINKGLTSYTQKKYDEADRLSIKLES
jgi:hypothetical protein